MLRVPVYSGVLKLKNVNKKRLCWPAKIARHRFANGRPFLVASVDIFARSVVYRNCYFSHYTNRTTQLASIRNVEKIRILILCCFKEKYFERSSPLICYELKIMT